MSLHCIVWCCRVLYCWLRRAGCISQDTYLLYFMPPLRVWNFYFWLFAKTTYCRVACKRSHHQTVVGSPDYLYYLHAPYLKLLIGKKTGFNIVCKCKYKLEFIFGIFHFWLVNKQIFWPRHDAGLNFLPCKLNHHILCNAIVILLMLVVNVLT